MSASWLLFPEGLNVSPRDEADYWHKNCTLYPADKSHGKCILLLYSSNAEALLSASAGAVITETDLNSVKVMQTQRREMSTSSKSEVPRV